VDLRLSPLRYAFAVERGQRLPLEQVAGRLQVVVCFRIQPELKSQIGTPGALQVFEPGPRRTKPDEG